MSSPQVAWIGEVAACSEAAVPGALFRIRNEPVLFLSLGEVKVHEIKILFFTFSDAVIPV